MEQKKSFGIEKRLVVASVVLVVTVIIALRLVLRPSPPSLLPPTGIERFFNFNFSTSVDPIVVERERALFISARDTLKQNPDFFDGWMTLAGTKKTVGDLKGAAEIWEYAGEIRPQNSVSFNNLADLYANFLYDYPKAEAAYRKAIQNSAGEDKNVMFYLSLVDLYRYKMNDFEKAKAALEEGIAANPGRYEIELKGARFFVDQGDREQALAHCRRSVQIAPKDAALATEYRQYRDQR